MGAPTCLLVVLPPDRTHLAKATDSQALGLAREILELRGTGPRSYRNAIVFPAWKSIVQDQEVLNPDAFQRTQAETFQWLLIPEQSDPKGPLCWKEVRLQGQEALAARASRKMRAKEELFVTMGG